jgi:hypothetical protein
MSSSLYEIVELSSGDVVLRRAEDESAEPLVKIQFSEESLNYLGEAKFAVAKAMIEAGMDAANDETQDGLLDEGESMENTLDQNESDQYILH